MYQFHQMHSQICITLTRCNLIVGRIRLMVWSRVQKKQKNGMAIFLNYGYFYILFILLCNWIKQAESVKTKVSIYPNLDFSKST